MKIIGIGGLPGKKLRNMQAARQEKTLEYEGCRQEKAAEYAGCPAGK